MSTGLKQEIARRWLEHQRLRKAGALYSAIVRLREIESCLEEPTIAVEWRELTRAVQFTTTEVNRALEEAQQRIARLRKVLATGSRFTYEEILLVITTRVELELFANFCADRRTGVLVQTDDLDGEIIALAKSRENERFFRQAQSAARENWGLPLKSNWLQMLTA
jgi:hypothetical protein